MLLNETNIDFQVSKAMEARQVEQRCVILMTKNSPFDVVRILAQGNIILDPYCLVQIFERPKNKFLYSNPRGNTQYSYEFGCTIRLAQIFMSYSKLYIIVIKGN